MLVPHAEPWHFRQYDSHFTRRQVPELSFSTSSQFSLILASDDHELLDCLIFVMENVVYSDGGVHMVLENRKVIGAMFATAR